MSLSYFENEASLSFIYFFFIGKQKEVLATQTQKIAEFEKQAKDNVDKTKKLQTKVKELEDKMLKANTLVSKSL